jgi:hypothetical protein
MVTKKVVNKTTFIQKVEGKFSLSVSWNCRKDNFHIQISRNGLSWYILAHRKKDDVYWNSLWTKMCWNSLEDAMEFASKFNYNKITQTNEHDNV